MNECMIEKEENRIKGVSSGGIDHLFTHSNEKHKSPLKASLCTTNYNRTKTFE